MDDVEPPQHEDDAREAPQSDTRGRQPDKSLTDRWLELPDDHELTGPITVFTINNLVFSIRRMQDSIVALANSTALAHEGNLSSAQENYEAYQEQIRLSQMYATDFIESIIRGELGGENG